MKKSIAFSIVFLLFFLVSCGNYSQEGVSGTGKMIEDKEDPTDITTQKWYKQRIMKKEEDLNKFYQTLLKFDISQQSQLPCAEYYPTDTEHFKSLYEEEQKMIQEYAKKCNDLKSNAKNDLALSGSVSSSGTQSATGTR